MPFYKFRLLRHGLWPNGVPSWNPEEINRNGVRGIWVKTLKDCEPDIALYYIHGGGFTMGSPYFYLEFLVSWASKLQDAGFKNPCIFALNYTLVPDSKFPTQLNEAYKGYRVLHDLAGDAELVISGDSAGGNIALSLLLYLSRPRNSDERDKTLRKPSYATLISPWTVLVSTENKNTGSDFLDTYQLHLYAFQYANSSDTSDPYKSPGLCKDLNWWRDALPVYGIHIVYGNQEVFTAGIRSLISQIESTKTERLRVTEKATVHVWPVVNFFIGRDMREREEGLQAMTGAIVESLAVRIK
ncbi:Acetyl-hydrolase [Dactylellina cionopaga]|nr:Acetyl-hydrolase [Dactylellina cionopaga]